MNDLISRQTAIDAIEHRLAEPAYQHEGEDWYTGMNCAESELYDLPSAQPETTRILAEALNGSPLLYPCDKLWSREGWCKDHCKKEQAEPDTECWLKYAETIAAERREE